MKNASEHLIVAGFLALYLGFCLPLLPRAVDDIRMAGVFSLDESMAAAEVRRLFGTGFWSRLLSSMAAFFTMGPWSF